MWSMSSKVEGFPVPNDETPVRWRSLQLLDFKPIVRTDGGESRRSWRAGPVSHLRADESLGR